MVLKMLWSVVVKDGIKGYIYVEAFKQSNLKAAIEDVGILRTGVNKQEVSVHVCFFCF
jgi:transcription elongation factor SPT5